MGDQPRQRDEPAQTVLVADDDPAVRGLLKRLLEQHRFRVETAADGGAALELVATVEPDLVLLDVLMPDLTGLEVCRRLKASAATRLLPVVLVTGSGEREDRIAGIEAGADDFLSKPFDSSELLARVRSLLRIKRYTDELERAESVLVALGRAVEERDPFTHGHCERLAVLAARLGHRLQLPPSRIEALERGGFLHDIGKITIPDAILGKPGPLTDEEREVIREHPAAGERICRGLRSLQPVLPIIRHHHERLDGSGYPDGLAGQEIPLTARILQIVDVYDALTNDRPYRKALPDEKALAIMETEVARGWWDPEIFDAFRGMPRDAVPSGGKPTG